jgi:hypothetical protein
MVPDFITLAERLVVRLLDRDLTIVLDPARLAQRKVDLDTLIALRARRLETPAVLPRAVRADLLNINRGRHDLDVVEAELRALRNDGPVERDHRAAIVVQPVAVAALLVRIQVHAAKLLRRLADKLDARVELAQLVVRAGRVREDLDTIEAHQYVRTIIFHVRIGL